MKSYRDRGIPRWWRNAHWGANGSPDWGEPPYPGWRKPKGFWDTPWYSIIIITIGIAGWLTMPLFFFMVI